MSTNIIPTLPVKPIYDLEGFARDVRELFARRSRLRAIWGAQKRLAPATREEIMLAVALANQASYCSFTHRSWAEHAGAPGHELEALQLGHLDGLEPSRRERIREALKMLEERWRQAGWNREPAADDELEDVATVTHAMTLANLSGNTFDAFLARLAGHPREDSRAVSEVVMASLFGLLLLPVTGLLVALRRQTPRRIVQEFARYRHDLEHAASG